jgi:hypothetical protein
MCAFMHTMHISPELNSAFCTMTRPLVAEIEIKHSPQMALAFYKSGGLNVPGQPQKT